MIADGKARILRARCLMKIQVASDLHLEFLEQAFPGERLIAPAAGADLLVLAGDIANGVRAVELFADWPVPVLYIAGNHEFYSRDWEQTREELRSAAHGTNVVYLDNDVADLSRFTRWAAGRIKELERLRFLGCTLWTDYRYHPLRHQSEQMAHAQGLLADHRVIRTAGGRFGFGTRHALQDHELSRAWLQRELHEPFDGRTVVITHHAPHPMSVHPRYRLDPDDQLLNGAFVSDLSELMVHADLWLHGHTHDSFDYRVGRCRVVANPRGYPRNRSQAATSAELRFENEHFKSWCVVEV